MLMTKKLVQNSRVAQNYLRERDSIRNMANYQEDYYDRMMADQKIVGCSGRIPQDVYREFDNVTIEEMHLDDGDTFLNDLMPLSKTVNIGKLVYENRRASDAGLIKTSMSGQTGILFDQVDYSYDGTIVPIHDGGFFRNFRELAAGTAEGFDALIDDQREVTRTLRQRLADTFMDGHTDEDGNFLKMKTYDWQGMRADSRVAAIDLGGGGINFDFTDNTKTGTQIKNAFLEVRDAIRVTNSCGKDLTVYISTAIATVWEGNFSTNYDGKLIIDQMAMVLGISAIKVSNKLTGNQMMLFPLDGTAVRPITGMGMSTFALPRPLYNSNHEFVTAAAVGWMVNTDFAGNTCAGYASA